MPRTAGCRVDRLHAARQQQSLNRPTPVILSYPDCQSPSMISRPRSGPLPGPIASRITFGWLTPSTHPGGLSRPPPRPILALFRPLAARSGHLHILPLHFRGTNFQKVDLRMPSSQETVGAHFPA